jgi:hypothetical protein
MSLGRPKFVFSKIGLTSVDSFRDDDIQIHKGRAGKSIPPYVKRGMLVRYLRGKQMKDYLRMVMQSL